MGLWETLLTGRAGAKQANLDALFLIPSAAITLQTAAGLHADRAGVRSFRAATGAAFQQTQDDVVALLNADPDAPDVEVSQDEFGFTWLVAHRNPTT